MKNVKLISVFISACCLVVISFINCSSPSPSSQGEPGNNDSQHSLRSGCFSRSSISQKIAKGQFIANATWNDPHVLKVGNQYLMYASADSNFDGDIKIFRFISSDAINWTLSPTTAVFSKNTDSSKWDRKSVETPSVVYFKGQYYLFYTGYPNNHDTAIEYKIFMATSSDGVTWTRSNFELAPTDPTSNTPNFDFNQWIVAEPGAVVFNDKLYVYFTALGASLDVMTTLQTIGVITSVDGVTWSSPQVAIKPNQVLFPRSSNWKGYSTPAAAIINNELNLFFNVVTDSPFKQLKIMRATSSDGLSNWVLDEAPILDLTLTADLSALSPWANVNIVSPTAVTVGKNTLLYFAGHGDTSAFPNVSMGIGTIVCN